MHRSCATTGLGVLFLALASTLASCASANEARLSDLRDGIAAGDECHSLFAIFEQVDEDSSQFREAQDAMRTVGCYTRDADRSDGGDPSSWTIDDPNSPWFEVHGEPVKLSTPCDQASAAAAAELDSTKADPLISASLYGCSTADEWMTALETYPGILGMMSPYTPIVLDLQSVCFGENLDAPVCHDAASIGVDVGS